MSARITSPRWLWLALILSLLVNVFCVGLIAGRFGHRLAGFLEIHRQVNDVLAPLPAPTQQRLRAELRSALLDSRAQFAALHTGRQQLLDHLAAPTLDPAAIEADFSRNRQQLQALQTALQQHLLQTVSTLDPNERQLLIESLRRRLPASGIGQLDRLAH